MTKTKAGKGPHDQRQQLAEVVRPVAVAMKAGREEAEALLAAAGDESDLPTLAEHIERHPPSALAIANLVWIARAQGRKRSSIAATNKKHTRHRDAKREALAWFASNRHLSKNLAAEQIGERWNVALGTARNWLKESNAG